MSDPTMLTDEQREKLGEGWHIVAWRDADGDHWRYGDHAEACHVVSTLPDSVPVWFNGYLLTR